MKLDSDDLFFDLDQRIRIALRILRLPDPEKFVREIADNHHYNPSLLFAYIRSFVRLAYLGDISLVAEELSTSRQTVARQIQELENLLECHLFKSIGRTSKMTDRGALWLPRAQEIYELAHVFVYGRGNNQVDFRSVQLPLRMLYGDDDAPELLKNAADAWMKGDKEVCNALFSRIEPYWILYDRQKGVWRSQFIGRKSSYADWFGPDRTAESVGLTVSEMAGGSDLRDELSLVLDGVLARGGLHFSEVVCQLTRKTGRERQIVRYQRLLMELVCNGRPIIASVIHRLSPAVADPTIV